jgi:hypothetical protein
MPERPLLIFPTPQTADRGSAGSGGPEKVARPTHQRQGERVAPKLTRLQAAFETRAAEVQATAAGIDPSQVIVIETIGSVENFAVAVRNIAGLEWLGDFDLEEISPDDDVHNVDSRGGRRDTPLRGRLYLILSDHAAIQQLLTLWTRYTNNRNMTWPNGLTSLRDVFNKLHDIRHWGIQDRLVESGALDAWRDDLEHYPDQSVRTEIEIWYRQSVDARRSSQSEIERLVRNVGGTVLKRCTVDAIAYHSLLVELPRASIQEMLDNPSTDLVKCDRIMFFRPTGQIVVGKQLAEGDYAEGPNRAAATYPTGDPCVAILDGLPVENHSLLADRLIVDDPDDLAPNYEVRHRVHGTGMCSLVIWGDLTERQAPLSRPVYVRPILKPIESWHSAPHPEHVPTDEMIVDIVHRAVRRLFDGEGDEPAAAPSVRIINLSIGDPSRPFFQMLSPLARLLDWLSHKYQVLFVISAGNQTTPINLGVTETVFRQLSQSEREQLVVHKLYEDARNRRLLSPAESINGLTVNAIHHDGGDGNVPGRLVECFSSPLPSPISAFGSGYRRSVKPDVVLSGGRVLYNFDIVQNTRIQCTAFRSRPGHEVASPGSGSDTDKTAYSRGTSNAAATTSRILAISHDSLLQLFAEQAGDADPRPTLAPMLKALLVHSSDWNTSGERLRELLLPLTDSKNIRHWISRWIGYGEPNINRMIECTTQRATVLGFGSLLNDQGHLFSLPLPPSLSSRTTKRRLTVSLAWFSPIVPTSQKYRGAHLWFEVPGNRLAPTRQDADWQAVRRGTVQHEVFEGDKALGISDGDSIQIKVNCREDAGSFDQPISYGLAVSLEVAEGISLPIYEEIRTRIRPVVGIRPRNPISS